VLLVLPGFPGAFSAHTMVQVGVTILALYLLRNTLRAPSVEFERTEIIFARTVLVGDIIRVLVNTINLYLIRAYMEPADVGIYAAGVRFTRMMEMLVLSPVAVPLLYYFSHPDSAHMKERIVRRGTRVVGAVMGLAALVLVVLAEPVVRIFLGEAYVGSADVARIYASHALGLGMLILVIPFYSSINKPHYTVMQGVLTFVVNLVLALILIPRYGPQGAAAAAVAAILVTVLAANVFLRLRFSIHGLSVVVRLFFLYGVSYALVEFGLPFVGIGLYAALVVPLGLIRRDDLDLLRRKSK
jgi:O-antigen/teichoic acid export membrane protein